MGRSIVIPEEHIESVYEVEVYNKHDETTSIKPRLKPQRSRGTYGLDDVGLAEFYYTEALGKLALAQYYMEKSASN